MSTLQESSKPDIINLMLDISETRHTALEMKKMMDQINPDLQFDLELEEDFEDMKLPTLDTAIWMSRTEDLTVKINYIFYEKPMNSVYVILENSAMDYRSKFMIRILRTR